MPRSNFAVAIPCGQTTRLSSSEIYQRPAGRCISEMSPAPADVKPAEVKVRVAPWTNMGEPYDGEPPRYERKSADRVGCEIAKTTSPWSARSPEGLALPTSCGLWLGVAEPGEVGGSDQVQARAGWPRDGPRGVACGGARSR